MGNRVQDKVAVITGSTSGVGEGIARGLAAEGAQVVISGRNEVEGARIVAEIEDTGGKAIFHRADISSETDCLALISRAVGHYGKLDILVNCAAALAQHNFDEMTVDEWDYAYAANVRGPFILSRAAIPFFRKQGGGNIVNIGTCMGWGGPPERIAYSTSKGALLNLTHSLARGFIHDKIRVNWITVGWVASPHEIALRDKTHGDGKKFLDEHSDKRPLGRHETPEDIAAGVLYLVSCDGSHVTGCELNISGGIRT